MADPTSEGRDGQDGRDGHRSIPPISTGDRGHAALLLVESLIHGLIARSILTVRDAVDIIDTAVEVEQETAQPGRLPSVPPRSLLAPIAASLRVDLKDPT